MSSSSETVSDTSDSSSSFSPSSSSLIFPANSWSDTTSEMNFSPPPAKRFKKEIMKDTTEISYENIIKSRFKWKIGDFRQVCKENLYAEKLESPPFTLRNSDYELTFCLQLYPRGISRSHKNKVACYLYMISSTEIETKVFYEFSIWCNKDKAVCSPTRNENVFSPGTRYGQKEIINTNLLLTRYHENDVCILQVDLTVHLNKNVTNNIKISNQKKIISYLENLFEEGLHSDATIKVENNIFKVHKCILAARSPVFAAMFEHDMIEKAENLVDIKDVNQCVMKEILRFAYTGHVENLDAIAKDLLAAANKFLFEDLKVICEHALFKNLSVDNVVEVLSFAEMHNALKLKEQALDYFVKNVKGVIETSSFKEMREAQQPLLLQVICKMAAKGEFSN